MTTSNMSAMSATTYPFCTVCNVQKIWLQPRWPRSSCTV